jgi:hypothetical protein
MAILSVGFFFFKSFIYMVLSMSYKFTLVLELSLVSNSASLFIMS